MKLTIMDYKGEKEEIDIGEIDDILAIHIRILTGDEIAVVISKNGDIDMFDSSNSRRVDCYDGEYTIYQPSENINRLEDPKWLERTDSYAFEEDLYGEVDGDE